MGALARPTLGPHPWPRAERARLGASTSWRQTNPQTRGSSGSLVRGDGAVWKDPARTDTSLLVLAQLVAAGTGTEGPCAAVAAAVGAAAVVSLTAVHYLHLDRSAVPFTSYVALGRSNSLSLSYLICRLGLITLNGPYLRRLS